MTTWVNLHFPRVKPTIVFKTCRSGAVGSALRDAIFVAGGYDGRSCLNSVERFDPVVQRWDFVASMNVARSFPSNFFCLLNIILITTQILRNINLKHSYITRKH